MRVLLMVLALIIAPEPVFADDPDVAAGLAAYHDGDFERAREIWQPLAEAGDAEAQAQLGALYIAGEGVAEDLDKAGYWINRSADQGSISGTILQGTLIWDAAEEDRDFARACDLFEKAAAAIQERRIVDAFVRVGWCYLLGKGRPQEIDTAQRMFEYAAHSGHPEAQYALGAMYGGAFGLPQDLVTAFMWLSLSADHGFASAQDWLRDNYLLSIADAVGDRGRERAREWEPDPVILANPPHVDGTFE